LYSRRPDFVDYSLGVELRRISGAQRGDGRQLDFCDAPVTRLLVGDGVGLGELRLGLARDRRRELGIGRGFAPLPRGLACLCRELADRPNRDLHLLVAMHDRAQHDVLGQALGLGFHHQYRIGGAGNHQVQRRGLQILRGRVEQILAIVVADTRSSDRPLEGHPGEAQRRRCAQHRRHVRIDLRVERHHRRDDLHLVVKAIGKERPDRAVDQPRGQRLFLGGATFALEEASGDSAGRVRLLDVVDSERQKVLAGGGFLAPHGRDEDDGVAHGNEDRAVGLTRNAAGLEGHVVRAVLKAFLVDVHDRWSGAD
jgi:hypothetical protein